MRSGLAWGAMVILLATGGALSGAGAATTTGFAFLSNGVDARSAILGEAMTSHVEGASACYWNPAGLAGADRAQLMLSHIESFADLRHEYGAAIQPLGRWVAGLFFNGLWTDDLEGYDRQANPTGTFGYASYAVGVSLGAPIPFGLEGGVTLKVLNESIDSYSASGWAADLGLQWDAGRLLPAVADPQGTRLLLGCAVRNLGGPTSFIEEEFDLPLAVQGGATLRLPLERLSGEALVSIEGRQVRDGDAALLMGGEYEFRDLLRIGFGYQTGHDTRDVSLGLGFTQGAVSLDWAFVPIAEDLGDEHRFSLTLGL